jgi:hypothetical protein
MKSLAALLLMAGLTGLAAAEAIYSDKNVYEPVELTWSAQSEFKNADAVFPHPLVNGRAVLTTSSGALQTEDGGRNWKPWADAARMGRIRTVAFDRMDPRHFLAAANGIWETTDNGATFRLLAAKQTGLASDTVADLIYYSGDPGNNTLLAVHGDAAAGISRSRDGGKTWDVVNPEYRFHRLLGGDSSEFKRLFLLGAPKDEPDILGLFMCTTPGEYVSELLRDVPLTDLAFYPAGGGDILYSTSDKGAGRIAGGRSSVGQEILPIELQGVPGWASLSVAWGPNADTLNLCGYDPSKAGFVMSGDNMKTFRTMGGVMVSPLVKQGAAVRPNANGTVFYAVANGALSIGRAKSAPVVESSPAVLELSQDDPTFNDAREAFAAFSKTADGRFGAAAVQVCESFGDLAAPYLKRRITVTATPAEKPAAMLIDLSRTGGTPDTPMFDDGKHNDGAPNDGTYGITFAYEKRNPQGDWRPAAPGQIPLGVAAVSPSGTRSGAVALAGVYQKVTSFDMWEKRGGPLAAGSEGEVSVRPTTNPADVHGGSPCFRIEPRGGPWSVSIDATRKAQDITGYEALSFWIRAAPGSEVPASINIQFVDRPDFSEQVTTTPVAILPDLIDQGAVGTDYRRVVIPLDLLMDSGFQPSRLSKIILSGDAKGPATLFLDGIRWIATRAELDTK